MTEKNRRGVLGIILPDGVIDADDRRLVIGTYAFFLIIGWVGKIVGISSSALTKINGILITSIARINEK